MTDPLPELLPCPNPWCDSQDVPNGLPRASEDVWSITDTITERFRVQCPYCQQHGPAAATEAEAIAAWNARVPPATITTEMALLEAIEATQVHQMPWLREDMAKRMAAYFAAWNQRAPKALAAEGADPVLVDRVWNALKQRVCADPEKAKRCVMVGRDDIAAALSAITDPTLVSKEQGHATE